MHSKGNYKPDERPPSESEKIFANKASNKGLISKLCKQVMQLSLSLCLSVPLLSLSLSLSVYMYYIWASLVSQTVKHLSAMLETQVQSLGREDPLEKEMATHSIILAWKIPQTGEPGRLQFMGLQRVRHDWVTLLYFIYTYTYVYTHTHTHTHTWLSYILHLCTL